MSNGAAVAAAVAAAIAHAIKASGVLVRMTPDDFRAVLEKTHNALIVTATGGVFSTKYKYLVSHKGFAFYTVSSDPIALPPDAETVTAKSIWIPG